MAALENMYYEDFHELYYQAYLQVITEAGRNQIEDDNIKEEIEELSDHGFGVLDQGLAIQQAVANKNKQRR